jgi:hypothetical protein
MSIFDEAQYKMHLKRLDRLKEGKKKAALDAQKNPYATYQGRDPVDGTEMVQIGTSESVSGFKLISNAPMAIGDRVALRKNNQGGLQRVDDRNRLIATDLEEESIKEKFTVEVQWVNGLDTVVLDESRFEVKSTNLYQYDSLGDKVTLISNLSSEAFWFNNGDPSFNYVTPTDSTVGQRIITDAVFGAFARTGDGKAACSIVFTIQRRGILRDKILKKMNGESSLVDGFDDPKTPIQIDAVINSYTLIGTTFGLHGVGVSDSAEAFITSGGKTDVETIEGFSASCTCDWRFVL